MKTDKAYYSFRLHFNFTRQLVPKVNHLFVNSDYFLILICLTGHTEQNAEQKTREVCGLFSRFVSVSTAKHDMLNLSHV